MNMQEAFDVAAGGMLKQRRKSQAVICGERQCCYRGEGGTRCAIGFLLSDAAYDVEFDALGISLANSGGCRIQAALEASGVDFGEPSMFSMLAALQEIHDCREVEQWPMRLLELAAEFELDGRIIAQ